MRQVSSIGQLAPVTRSRARTPVHCSLAVPERLLRLLEAATCATLALKSNSPLQSAQGQVKRKNARAGG
jgi:hypothetical protein